MTGGWKKEVQQILQSDPRDSKVRFMEGRKRELFGSGNEMQVGHLPLFQVQCCERCGREEPSLDRATGDRVSSEDSQFSVATRR